MLRARSPLKNHSPLKNSRMARRRRLVIILKVGAVAIVLAGLLYGVAWASRQAFWTIQSVSVSGVSPETAQTAQTIARADLSGAYGLILSKKNELIYPRGKIIADLEKTFPQIASVQLAIQNHILTITLTERQGAYWWCAASSFAPSFPDSTTILATKQCDHMDSNGFIFMPVKQATTTVASSTLPFRFYGTSVSTTATTTASTTTSTIASTTSVIGTSYMHLTAGAFDALGELISILKNHGLPSYALVDRPDGVDELYLNAGGMIVFDADQNLNQVASDIAALQANTTIFSGVKPFAYVDVRIGNKAFYRFGTINGSLNSSSTLHTTATSSAG